MTNYFSDLWMKVLDSNNSVKTGGSVASGSTDAGNPVKTGGVYNTSAPTLTTGQRGDTQMDASANTKMTLATALGRSTDSVTNYQASCTITIVDLSTDADVVVTSAPAVLLGVYIDTVMSAHVALIKDFSTTLITLAASTAAGTKYDTHSALFATNITVESDNAATGKLAIFWRAA